VKIKLKDIKQDPTILELRPTNPVVVSRYRQAMRCGDVFPKPIIDQKRNIVAGNHRYEAYLGEYGEDHEIEAIQKKYKDEASRIEDAIRDNARHGSPLDGISRRRAILKLTELGRSTEAIATLLGVSCKRVCELAGMSVLVIGGGTQPIKHGLEHMAGRQVTQEEYDQHRTRDRGVPVKQAAQQLIRWIENGWIDTTDEAAVDALQCLARAIEENFAIPA
jgi:hypothetical protein